MNNKTSAVSQIGSEVKKRKKVKLRKGRIAALASLVLVGCLYGFASKTIFARPAADAIRMLPKSASLVVALDLKPALGQLLTFKSISDLLVKQTDAKNGSGELLDKRAYIEKGFGSLLEMWDSSDWVKKLSPHLQKSITFAILDRGTGAFAQVVILPVTQSAEVRQLVESAPIIGKYRQFGINTSYCTTVVEDCLVICSDEAAMDGVIAVSVGGAQGVQSVAEFSSARSSVDSNAQLLCFATSKMFLALHKQVQDQTLRVTPKWAALAATVRRDGLLVESIGEFGEGSEYSEALSKIPPVPSSALSLLPEGAVGFLAVSQPTRVYQSLVGLDDAKATESLQAFALKEFDLDLPVLESALDGKLVYAWYPLQQNSKETRSVLALDRSNGGNPGPLFDALRNRLKREGQRGKSVQFTEKSIGSAPVFTYKRKKPSGSAALPNSASLSKVNGNVILATNVRDLDFLQKPTPSGTKTILGDSKFSSQFLGIGQAQLVFALSPARAVDFASKRAGYQSRTSKLPTGVDKLLEGLSRTSQPLVITSEYRRTSIVAKIFIPLDYESIGEFLSDAVSTNGVSGAIPK